MCNLLKLKVTFSKEEIKDEETDEVVGLICVDPNGSSDILVVSEKGYGKRTKISEFKVQQRSGKGLICYNATDKTGELIGMKLVNDDRDIMLITNEGILIRMGVSDISIIGRNTSGVKLMSIDPDSDTKVATIAKVRESNTNQDNDAVEENTAE